MIGQETITPGCCERIQDTEMCNRLRFWEIDSFFKCPIVGSCLTRAEQRKLLKTAGISTHAKSCFEIHETLVASAEDKNPLSARIDARLYRKFGKTTSGLFGLDSGEFMEQWRKSFASGSWSEVFWAAVSRPVLVHEYKREIFGDVHMSMHWNAEESQRLKKNAYQNLCKVDGMRDRLKDLTACTKESRKECEQLQRRNTFLESSLALAHAEHEKRERVLAALKEGYREDNIQRLKEENKRLVGQFRDLEERNRFLEQEKRNMAEELDHQRDLNTRFQKEAGDIIRQVSGMKRCDASCPSFDLCKKRVLLVGGITRMESLYRQLVENRGGVFDYHDGYMNGGSRSLENRLKHADVVLCPVNCNSHGACNAVKNLAKKHNKTLHMLSSSSLNALSRVISGQEGQDLVLN